MDFPIYDPTFQPSEQAIQFVPRPGSLQNLRIGLIENTKTNSAKLLLKIADILEKEYGAQSHTIRSKRNPGVPPDEKVIKEITANCDVVVAGVGD